MTNSPPETLGRAAGPFHEFLTEAHANQQLVEINRLRSSAITGVVTAFTATSMTVLVRAASPDRCNAREGTAVEVGLHQVYTLERAVRRGAIAGRPERHGLGAAPIVLFLCLAMALIALGMQQVSSGP